MLCQELDGKIGHLVIELQKKKRALEQEHTETQMVQVSTLGSLGSEVTGVRGHWNKNTPRPRWYRSVHWGHWGQRSLAQEHTETQMVQVSTLGHWGQGSLGSKIIEVIGHWGKGSLRSGQWYIHKSLYCKLSSECASERIVKIG